MGLYPLNPLQRKSECKTTITSGESFTQLQNAKCIEIHGSDFCNNIELNITSVIIFNRWIIQQQNGY